MMGSDLFINNALSGMNTSYRILGVGITNFVLNNTVVPLFCAGETIDQLKADILEHKSRNVNVIGNYICEGLGEIDEAQIQQVSDEFMRSIEAQTENGWEGHFSIKFTALLEAGLMTKLNSG